MSPRLVVLLVAVLLLAGACSTAGSGGSDEPTPTPDYSPIADDKLYSRIAALPGVEKAEISLNDTFPDYAYVGEVDISADADAQTVLDTIYATLRQGRYRAAINITGYQSGRDVRLEALDRSGGPTELEKRYGPQPGDGTPPA